LSVLLSDQERNLFVSIYKTKKARSNMYGSSLNNDSDPRIVLPALSGTCYKA